MPNKHNADRRHHFGKIKFKVRNWASYEAGLRRRGSLTLWVTEEAIAKWGQDTKVHFMPLSRERMGNLSRLHQLRGLGDAKLLKSLGRSFKGRHYRG
jgi:hypothetical protein